MQKFDLEKAKSGSILVDKDGNAEYSFYAYNKTRGTVFVKVIPDTSGYMYEFKQDNIFIKDDT